MSNKQDKPVEPSQRRSDEAGEAPKAKPKRETYPMNKRRIATYYGLWDI